MAGVRCCLDIASIVVDFFTLCGICDFGFVLWLFDCWWFVTFGVRCVYCLIC